MDKRRPDPNTTIQIDQLDALDQVIDDARPSAAPGRRTPPPLPASTAPPTPVAEPATAPKSAPKTVVMVGAFLLLLALAISAGLLVGRGVRGAPPAASTVVVTAPAPSAPAAPSASTEIMTLPPVDIK